MSNEITGKIDGLVQIEKESFTSWFFHAKRKTFKLANTVCVLYK